MDPVAPLITVAPPAYAALLTLFPVEMPNAVMARAVLQQRAVGTVWTDPAGQACLVETGAAYCLIGGEVDQATAAAMLASLRGRDDFSLVVPATAAWSPWLERQPGLQWVARRHFSGEGGRLTRQTQALAQPPAGYTLAPLDAARLPQAAARDALLAIFGSVAAYTAHGFGRALVRDEQVVSEAYGGFVSESQAELGTLTRVDSRGHGLATVVCAAAMGAGVARGLQPTWSCDEENLAAGRVAEKLGLEEDPPYMVVKPAAR